MKDYNEFDKYLREHEAEILYDVNHLVSLSAIQKPDIVLTQNDLKFLVSLTSATLSAVLRQYHQWSEAENP